MFQHDCAVSEQYQHHYDLPRCTVYFSTIMMLAFHSSIITVQTLMPSYLFVNGQRDASSDRYRIWLHGSMLHVVFRVEHKSTAAALIWAARKGSDLPCGHDASYLSKRTCYFFHFILPTSHFSLRV